MKMKRLGRTNLEVSEVSFGCLPIQRISHKEAEELLLYAFKKGINFFDTANMYTDSEEKIGNALSEYRSQIILATKSEMRGLRYIEKNLEQSLRALKTDYIDIYQLHNITELPKKEVIDLLLKAKSEGKIRFLGVTTHRLDLAHKALDMGVFDTLQYPFSFLSDERERELAYRCKEEDIGFIAMKALSGGLITDAEAVFAFMSRHKNVVPIYGMQKKEELVQFLSYTKHRPKYDDEMRARIQAYCDELSGDFCRGCGYCQPCPMDIDIWQCARMSFMLKRAPEEKWLSEKWRREMDKIYNCIDCGRCKSRCPYGLNTPLLLRRELARYDEIYYKTKGNEK